MPLKLYRRHRKECEGHHPEDSLSGQFEEGRRGWKRCACQIHASGTLGRKFKRMNTGYTNWEDARAVAGEWERTRSWSGEVVLPMSLPAPARTTIEKATKAFLKELQEIFRIVAFYGFCYYFTLMHS